MATSKIPRVSNNIYNPYTIDLTEAEREDISTWISERLEDALTAQGDRNENIEEWRNSYAGDQLDREPAYEERKKTITSEIESRTRE